jgi:tyrosyl-tRNA synthetase
MDLEERIRLISRPPTEEIIEPDELKSLLESSSRPLAYNGFEPSGQAHLGTGLVAAMKVNDLTAAGCRFLVFLADWHAWVNGKLGSNLERIRSCGQYLIEVWKSLGVDTHNTQFVFGTDVYNNEYWKTVLKVAGEMNLTQARKSLTISGRRDSENLPLRNFIYTPMQVADIFHMHVDICQLGIDQRKANILAREIGPKLDMWKPLCVHHHLLMGLQGPKRMGFEEDEALDMQVSGKMGKSVEGSAIYVHDTPAEIRTKILAAYCPEKDPENPILDMVHYLLMRDEQTPFLLRTRKNDEIYFEDYFELDRGYTEGRIHPLDLKISVAESLAKVLEPCRRHFETDREARKLLALVKSTETTR